MANRFKNKYRIPSTRARWWDYGDNGAYFITICTSDRIHYFGKVVNQKMRLTPVGIRAWKCWLEIPQHFPFVKLGAFVVMPNHVHGIITIDKPANSDDVGDGVRGNDGRGDDGRGDDGRGDDVVEAQNIAPLQRFNQNPSARKSKNRFGPQSQNLASIIRGFKIGVTVFCRNNGIEFGWQALYHDHIIRGQQEFDRIAHYIRKNPENWCKDRFKKPV